MNSELVIYVGAAAWPCKSRSQRQVILGGLSALILLITHPFVLSVPAEAYIVYPGLKDGLIWIVERSPPREVGLQTAGW